MNTTNIQLPERKLKLIIPFIPGVSERLKRVAKDCNVRTWFTYPGRLSDWFTAYRGRQHLLKAQHTVYCVACSCGLQYVGESKRNLKVHLSEHQQGTLSSALSIHLNNNEGHDMVPNDTLVLAREKNGLKRKMVESMAITNKQAAMCNTRVSLEMPAIWTIFAEKIKSDLAYSD